MLNYRLFDKHDGKHRFKEPQAQSFFGGGVNQVRKYSSYQIPYPKEAFNLTPYWGPMKNTVQQNSFALLTRTESA